MLKYQFLIPSYAYIFYSLQEKIVDFGAKYVFLDSLVKLWCVNARNYNRSFQEHYHFLFNMAVKFLGQIDRGATGTQKKILLSSNAS